MSVQASDHPLAITVNGQSRPLPNPATLLAVLEEAGVAGRPIAVELEGEVVPRGQFGECLLTGGERIEIVTFVGGG